MKKILLLILSTVLSGCVSLDHIQGKMNELDKAYRIENEKLIQALGTKFYKIGKDNAHAAMLLALTNLEMTIENQDVRAGYINATARMPRPLSNEEFDRAWALERPRAKEITGLDIKMSGNSEVKLNIIMIERGEDVQVNIRFRTKYIGNTYGLVISDQAPPEAVRIGYPKIWNEFEKIHFIQGRLLR